MNTTAIRLNNIKNSEIISDTRDFDMSISINPSGTIVAIGQGSFDVVTIAVINGTNTSKFISEMYEITEDKQLTGFGHSVAWLDDNGTLAVLLDKSGSRKSLESEIQVYTQILPDTSSEFIVPSFTLPNNQQALHRIKSSRGWNKHTFLTILARSNNFLILRDDAKIIYMRSTDPGLCSMEPLLISQTRLSWNASSESLRTSTHIPQNKFNESFLNVYVLQPQSCVSGTYKNVPGFGPCTVCPPGTKNSGHDQLIECQTCTTGWFCPLGATDDVNITDFISYNQTFNYPDSPIIDNYDDLLILNFFPNTWTFDCIVSSPLPWVLLSILICFIIWIIMILIKKRQPTIFDIHRKRAKLVFKQMDLISEGERFVGGLASIVVFVVVIYSIIYATVYFHSYSVEDVEGIRTSCGDQEQNTQFDNALQLPLPEPEGYYWEIFHMLDKQKFHMVVDLINTRAQCDKINVQHNKLRGEPETIAGEHYIYFYSHNYKKRSMG
jgi:hypothetical protein